MAFNLDNFAVDGSHANPNIVRRHAYITDDAAATVDTEGYFNEIADRVSVGDYIDARANGVNVAYVVNANDGTTVDVTDGDAASTTDTD